MENSTQVDTPEKISEKIRPALLLLAGAIVSGVVVGVFHCSLTRRRKSPPPFSSVLHLAAGGNFASTFKAGCKRRASVLSGLSSASCVFFSGTP